MHPSTSSSLIIDCNFTSSSHPHNNPGFFCIKNYQNYANLVNPCNYQPSTDTLQVKNEVFEKYVAVKGESKTIL